MAGRAFVVTGANRGIGFETVRELGKRLNPKDAAIVLCSRTSAAGETAASSLAKEGIKADVEVLDITNEGSRRKFVTSIQNKYKHVDCLINNAGINFPPGAKLPLSEQARAICAVNYYGTRDTALHTTPQNAAYAPRSEMKAQFFHNITMALAPLFRNNTKVVFLSSNLEKAGPPFMSKSNRDRLLASTATVEDIDAAVHEYLQVAPKEWIQKGWPRLPYLFSKAAVIGLTAALARKADRQTLNPNAEGIIVTAVYPGWCKTDMAGWKAPPLSAAEGSKTVAELALSAGRKEQGKLVVEGREIRTPSEL